MESDAVPRLGPSARATPEGAARLRVLHLEDSELDHHLMVAQLMRGGLHVDVTRVETEAAFNAALAGEAWDAVVSDYSLPGYNGLLALETVVRSGRNVPFVLVSGEIGEDTAVAAMRLGAADYLLKNNLARLAPALLNAIERARSERQRHEATRELESSKRRLRELAQHLQTSVEAERAAIAREIHDDVGGSLTALKFDLAWIARRSADPDVQQRVAGALETVTHAIESSQRIMHDLRPAILEQGLVAAVQWMAGRFEKRTGVACVTKTSHDSMNLPSLVSLVAYRTAQEALTNVSKHARAKRVTVDLTLAGGVLTLEVSDNGRGMSQDDLDEASGFGIRGLHERASTVGGWVDLASGPDGTSLILSVPIDEATKRERAFDAETRRPEADSHDPSAWGSL